MQKNFYVEVVNNMSNTKNEKKQENIGRLENLPIEDIIIGERARKEINNSKEFVDSVTAKLLQPIPVTPHLTEPGKYELACGECRLQAFIERGYTHIPAIIHDDIESIPIAESVENTLRKDLDPFEKMFQVDKIIKELGDRRGRPYNDDEELNVCSGQTFKLVPMRKGEKGVHYACRVRGISYHTYVRTKEVFACDNEVLKKVFRRKGIPIKLAHKISLLPREEQDAALRGVKDDGSGEIDLTVIRSAFAERALDNATTKKGIDRNAENKYVREEGFNVVYAALKPNFKESDFKVLSKFPIKRHGEKDALVCISCNDVTIHYALRLLEDWGLVRRGIVQLVSTKIETRNIDKLNGNCYFVVIGQYEVGKKNIRFENSKIPHVSPCEFPHLDAQAFITRTFGKDASGRILDITSPPDATVFDGWFIHSAGNYTLQLDY